MDKIEEEIKVILKNCEEIGYSVDNEDNEIPYYYTSIDQATEKIVLFIKEVLLTDFLSKLRDDGHSIKELINEYLNNIK